MKLKRKLLAGLLTLCMAVVMAVPAFAANGPSSGDMSSAWVQLVQGETGKFLYSNSGKVDTVEGAVYVTIISPNWLYGASAGAAIWKLPETAP